jgi:DNA-binding NarL/FixJ family response regulator
MRERLPPEIEVVAEAATLRAARSFSGDADGWLLTPAVPALGTDDEVEAEALTPREREVLALMADGLSNRGIASALGISDQTVKFHVAAICGKLGAANRTQAVRRGLERGLIAL